MLNDEICKLRDKLNKSIEEGKDYDIIYKLSIELDELIASYYAKDRKKKTVMMIIWKNDSPQWLIEGGFFLDMRLEKFPQMVYNFLPSEREKKVW